MIIAKNNTSPPFYPSLHFKTEDNVFCQKENLIFFEIAAAARRMMRGETINNKREIVLTADS